jgi:hypothetical protein
MSANVKFKSFKAAVDIPANSIVKFTANDGEVTLATAATDKIAGVTDSVDVKAGSMVDVAFEGLHPVKAGGVIAAGDPLTADATSRAVAATFTAATMKFVIGPAAAKAVAGDLVLFHIAPSVIAG